ncbi:MAG TPA: AAA domain-containing protein [Gemmataceae bacterium]|nr:AAA domain-containing protein [Gemmataceae bacterium]
MSQREGHATGGAAPRAADAPPPGATRPAAVGSRDWVEVFPALPPERQQQLLDLAHRQGFLLADQIPPAPSAADPARPVLQQALAGQLPPVPLPDPIDSHDTELDDAQRDAVARALSTPDLFLILGPAGTGKSRVAAEVVRQVAAGGARALFLAPDPGVLDTLLPRLAEAPGIAISRRLGPGESIDRLSPAVAALTPAVREAAVREALIRQSAETMATTEDRARRLETLGPIWDELDSLRARQASRAGERESLATKRNTIADEVRKEANASGDAIPYFVQRLRGAAGTYSRRTTALDANAAELRATRTEAEDRHRAAEAECRELRPKAESLRARRWYTLAYWKARSDDTLTSRLAEAERRLAAATEALAELAVREQKLAADRRMADDEQAALTARILEGETARRLAEMDACAVELAKAAAADSGQEAELAARVREAGVDRPDRAAGAEALAAARRELDFARGWVAQVEGGADDIVREACARVSVAAGPVGCVTTDPWFASAERFDLLVIDDAHQVSEADFLPAARLARRWVLIGEGAAAPAHRGSKKAGPDLLARLAGALRHDVWDFEGRRPVCRLHPVRGGERRRLECEPVADAPDIELRLFAPPAGDPVLAEVAFPEGTTPVIAREYLHRELGEVTCQPRARTPKWETKANGIVARFGPADPSATFAVIGPGVHEELTGHETRAVHFGCDWTPERAREWAATHLTRPAGARVVNLSHPYRACPGLARWLNQAFAAGFAVSTTGDDGPHVEFLAVPDADPRRRHGHNNGRPVRVGGAGYEIDLADPRQRAALPVDLTELPATGFVNVPEAQALVRFLEMAGSAGAAVTSPFPSQVVVLRKLIARSGRLASVLVLDAADAGRHECDLLVVSLTRSHVARAVTFGEAPAVLAGLLTRARKKLLFAGDPGTLARRLQWEGPVDHLDAADAARERAWVAALADCPRVSPHRHRHHSSESAGK